MVEKKKKVNDDPVLERIMGLLEKRSITEKELIDRLEMARGTFSAWKQGRARSYLVHTAEIAEILDVSPNYLLRGTDDEVGVETLSESEIQLIKEYRAVGNDGRRLIDEVITYIVKAKEGGKG